MTSRMRRWRELRLPLTFAFFGAAWAPAGGLGGSRHGELSLRTGWLSAAHAARRVIEKYVPALDVVSTAFDPTVSPACSIFEINHSTSFERACYIFYVAT